MIVARARVARLERQLAEMLERHRREEKKLAARLYRAVRVAAVKKRKER